MQRWPDGRNQKVITSKETLDDTKIGGSLGSEKSYQWDVDELGQRGSNGPFLQINARCCILTRKTRAGPGWKSSLEAKIRSTMILLNGGVSIRGHLPILAPVSYFLMS